MLRHMDVRREVLDTGTRLSAAAIAARVCGGAVGRMVEESPQGIVVRSGPDILGVALLRRVRIGIRAVGILTAVAVVPEARRTGIGRSAADAALAQLDAVGIKDVWTATAAGDEPAARMVTALGFRPAGLVEQMTRTDLGLRRVRALAAPWAGPDRLLWVRSPRPGDGLSGETALHLAAALAIGLVAGLWRGDSILSTLMGLWYGALVWGLLFLAGRSGGGVFHGAWGLVPQAFLISAVLGAPVQPPAGIVAPDGIPVAGERLGRRLVIALHLLLLSLGILVVLQDPDFFLGQILVGAGGGSLLLEWLRRLMAAWRRRRPRTRWDDQGERSSLGPGGSEGGDGDVAPSSSDSALSARLRQSSQGD